MTEKGTPAQIPRSTLGMTHAWLNTASQDDKPFRALHSSKGSHPDSDTMNFERLNLSE